MLAIPIRNDINTATKSSAVKAKLTAFKRMFPAKTIGKLKIKLILNDWVSSKPLRRRVATVIPERENPGNTDNPCATPVSTPSMRFACASFLCPSIFFLS